jgi:hypothetical protein
MAWLALQHTAAAATQCHGTAMQAVRQCSNGPESAVCYPAAAPGAIAAVLQLWRAVLLLTSTQPDMLCSQARIGATLRGVAHNRNHMRDYERLQRAVQSLPSSTRPSTRSSTKPIARPCRTAARGVVTQGEPVSAYGQCIWSVHTVSVSMHRTRGHMGFGWT